MSILIALLIAMAGVFGILAYRATTQDRASLFTGLAIACAVGGFLDWLVF